MSKKHLSEYFDSIVKNAKEEEIFESFSMYVEEKGKSVLKSLMEEAKKPIRMKGDDVLVNGKKVGSVEHEEDSDKLTFHCDTSDKDKKFDSVSDLYAYLTKEHKLDEAALADVGPTDLKSKAEKEIKDSDNKKNGKQLKKETGYESHASKEEDTESKSAVEAGKAKSRKRVDKFSKPDHDIKWRD